MDNNTIVVGNGTGQTTFSATGITGTGANDRLAVWSGTGTQDSDSNLTWDGTTLTVSGTISGADLATGVTIDSNTILRGTAFGSTRLVISGTNGAVSTDSSLTYLAGGGGGLASGILHSYTNVVDYPVQLNHETSGGGNPTAGFGVGIKMRADNGASSLHEIGTLEWVWTTVTDTAEVSDLVGYAYEGGAKTEVFRADTSANQFNLPTGWAFAVNGTPLSSGGISASGTPVNNQLAVWTDASTVEGDSNLTWDASTLTVGGAVDLTTNPISAGSAYLTEKAAASADVTGDGQVWVKNDATQRPMFTDESGTDKTILTEHAIGIAVGDETTAITTGTAKVTFRMPYAFTLTGVRASLTTAGSGTGTTTFDINEGGTTVLSTKLTIDATEKTSTTAAAAAVISDSALADDAEITVDVDAITSGAVEAGAKIWLIGYRPL